MSPFFGYFMFSKVAQWAKMPNPVTLSRLDQVIALEQVVFHETASVFKTHSHARFHGAIYRRIFEASSGSDFVNLYRRYLHP